ncbi:MAG: hypothetical protein II098_00120 [Treponema sp.]|nr:hypothetical protein [Treponema sp.]
MKKIIALVFAATAFIFGCSNTDNNSEKLLMASFLQNNTSQKNETVINLKKCLQSSRCLFPDNDELIENFDDVEWNLHFSPSEINTYKEANTFYCDGIRAVDGKISLKAIKKGIYDINLNGTYQKDSETFYYFAGEKNNVDLAGQNEIELEVSYVQSGTGSYSFDLEFDDNWDLDQITEDNVSLRIVPFSYYTLSEEELQRCQPVITVAKVPETGETEKVVFTATNEQINSGFYQIEVSLNNYTAGSFGNSVKIEKVVLSDSVLAVTSKLKTAGTISACFSLPSDAIADKYYATNDTDAKGNGLYLQTRGYVWDIISTIVKADWSSVDVLEQPILIYCEDFTLDVSNYNTLLKRGGVYAEDSTFDGSIKIMADNAVYLLSPDSVILQSGTIKLSSSQAKYSSTIPEYTDLTIEYPENIDSCRFSDHTNVEVANFFTKNVYFESPSDYLNSETPFIKITKAAVDKYNESVSEPVQKLRYFTDGNGDGSYDAEPSTSLKIYTYDSSKETYYLDYSYVYDCKLSEDKETWNVYLKKLAMTNIIDIEKYLNLSISATGFVNGEAKTYKNSDDDIVFDYNKNDSGIALEASYNPDCTDTSVVWKLNGKNIDASTNLVMISYSEMLIGKGNYVSCYATYGGKEYSSMINFSFNSNYIDADWVAYEDRYNNKNNQKFVIGYYEENLDVSDSIGKSKVLIKNNSIESATSEEWNHWNLNDGYLYAVKKDADGAYSLIIYKMNPLTKEFNDAYTAASAVSNILNDGGYLKYNIVDITKANESYYMLLQSTETDTNYNILVCSAIAKQSYDEGTGYASKLSADFSVEDIGELYQISAYGNYVYMAAGYSSGIYKVEIPISSLSDISAESVDAITSSTFPAIFGDGFPITADGVADKSYTDMAVIGSKLYCTLKAATSFISDLNYTNLGGIACLKIDSDGTLSLDGLSGVANRTELVNGGSTSYVYAPFGDKNPEAFFGIEKILAIKEDYLLLQDCGVYLTNESKSDYCFFKSDRIVYFDLKTNTIDVNKTRTDFKMNKASVSGTVIY